MKPWHLLDANEVVAGLRSLIDVAESAQGNRLARMREAAARYDLAQSESLSSYSRETYSVEIDDVVVRWPLGRMVVKALLAKIAGTQQPKVQFVVSEDDWKTRRTALKGNQFIEGLWSTRQEPYADIWELGVMVMRDALTAGSGHVKVIADSDLANVIHERVLPEDILYLPSECRSGMPLTLIQRFEAGRSPLKAQYPEMSEAVEAAPAMSASKNPVLWSTQYDQGEDRVLGYEVWRRSDGPNNCGRHVVFLDGSTVPLLDEDWERDSFPIVSIYFDRALRGMDGVSLMDETRGSEYAINELLNRVLRTVRRTSLNTVFASADSVNREQVLKTCDAGVVDVVGPNMPILQVAEPVGQTVIELMNLL